MRGIFGLLGKLARSAGSSAVGTATVLGVAGAMQKEQIGPQLQGATLEHPQFVVNQSRSFLGLNLDGGSEFFYIGAGALILSLLISFCCSGLSCRACRAWNRRRSRLKELKEEKIEMEEGKEKDRDLENAIQRLKSKIQRAGRGGESGGVETFQHGLDY